MAWLLLFIAGAEEVVAAVAMKHIDGFKKKVAADCHGNRLYAFILLPFRSDAGSSHRCRVCGLDRHGKHRRFGRRHTLV